MGRGRGRVGVGHKKSDDFLNRECFRHGKFYLGVGWKFWKRRSLCNLSVKAKLNPIIKSPKHQHLGPLKRKSRNTKKIKQLFFEVNLSRHMWWKIDILWRTAHHQISQIPQNGKLNVRCLSLHIFDIFFHKTLYKMKAVFVYFFSFLLNSCQYKDNVM